MRMSHPGAPSAFALADSARVFSAWRLDQSHNTLRPHGRRSVLPHIRRLVLHVLSKTDAASADANTRLFRQISGLAPGGKDDNVDEYCAFERFCDPSYGWRTWNRRSDLFRR